MRKLTLASLSLMLACHAAMAAEEEPADTTQKPAETKPQPAQKPLPGKTEYDKLPYAAVLKKAETGDLKAQFELGSRYNYGRDLPKNTREALRWLRKAAQSGHTEAQRLLAVKLFEGHDTIVDQEEAFKWAQRLADSGDRPGQLMLGKLYANGEGIARDLIRAYMWFDIAATPVTGKALAELDQKALDAAVQERDKTASLLLPEDEVEAQQLASEWWLKKHTSKPVAKKKKAVKPAASKPVAKE